VPGLQSVVLLTILLIAHDTIVRDDSYLCITCLLAPVVAKLEDRGSLLSVQDVVEELGDDSVRLNYGWDQVEGRKRVRILELERGKNVRKRAIGPVKQRYHQFPEGKYE